MATEYMGRVDGHTNSATREYPVASGVTVNEGDFVYLNADGRISNATITSATELLGTVVGNSDPTVDDGTTAVGNAGGTVKVLVNIEKEARYLVDTDAAITEANIGDALDLQGNTGAQDIDVAKASPIGQLRVVGLGNGLRGRGTSSAVVVIAAHQLG